MDENQSVTPNSDENKAAVDELDELRTEVEQTKDHALRCQAELENYRRRITREMEDERRYAPLRLLRDLLPVVDNVERGVLAAEKSNDPAVLLQGFKLVAKQLEGLLERYHCLKIEALNCEFDPARHEAIGHQPSPEVPANAVLLVAQNGYMLYNRVVRPSQVIVSAGKPAEETPATGWDAS